MSKKYSDYYLYKVYMSSGSFPDGGRWKGYVYEIYTRDTKELVRESEEWFDNRARAIFAAVGHISLLENGEG